VPVSTRSRDRCSSWSLAVEKEVKEMGRRDLPWDFSDREIKNTNILTIHQEPLHPEENMYFERENGENIFCVASLSDIISSLSAGNPK
jgi:hypothetical protein